MGDKRYCKNCGHDSESHQFEIQSRQDLGTCSNCKDCKEEKIKKDKEIKEANEMMRWNEYIRFHGHPDDHNLQDD